MRYLYLFLVLTFSSFGLVACGLGGAEPEERSGVQITDIADDLIADSQTVVDLLQSVDSVEDAEAIRPQLDDLAVKYQNIGERMKEMEQPNFAVMRSMISRGPKLAETQTRVLEEIERIRTNHPEAAAVIQEKLESFANPPTLSDQ